MRLICLRLSGSSVRGWLGIFLVSTPFSLMAQSRNVTVRTPVRNPSRSEISQPVARPVSRAPSGGAKVGKFPPLSSLPPIHLPSTNVTKVPILEPRPTRLPIPVIPPHLPNPSPNPTPGGKPPKLPKPSGKPPYCSIPRPKWPPFGCWPRHCWPHWLSPVVIEPPSVIVLPVDGDPGPANAVFRLTCYPTTENLQDLNGLDVTIRPEGDGALNLNGTVGFVDPQEPPAGVTAVAQGTFLRTEINLSIENVGNLYLLPQIDDRGRTFFQGDIELYGKKDSGNLACVVTIP